ncbi:hypothetical protein XarbCFBP8142_07410 [Xanthomonas arboricola]|nr:hypothetical protein XarbCFBP8142_07410 [Xanthomonas arboricola]
MASKPCLLAPWERGFTVSAARYARIRTAGRRKAVYPRAVLPHDGRLWPRSAVACLLPAWSSPG